jgi:hypothetical protein
VLLWARDLDAPPRVHGYVLRSFFLLTTIFSLCFSGVEAAEAFASETDNAEQAEYVRLANEMARLASRNAWSGVERLFLTMSEMNVELSFEDFVSGAHSARAQGNITAVKERLSAATALREDKEITDWLFDLDGSYGRVFVSADKGKATLSTEKMPFHPDQRKAIEYAVVLVDETGTYDGLLPAGDYAFGQVTLEVIPRVQSIRIDLRTERFRKKQARQAEKGE